MVAIRREQERHSLEMGDPRADFPRLHEPLPIKQISWPVELVLVVGFISVISVILIWVVR